ncbi:MAG: hypothetical protein DRI90_27790, partial [Deltaproteobacteria bacterium]
MGVVRLGRGGAWLARADDPLAFFVNPAAMVTQPSGVHLGAHLMFLRQCFDRRNVDGEPVEPGRDLAAPPGEVCGDAAPFPNPQLGAIFRLHKRFALGVGTVSPHAAGTVEWPETMSYTNRFGVDADHPAPQRYLLMHREALVAFPTLSAAVAITKDLSVGAGFVWGLASLETSNMTEAISIIRGDPQPDDHHNDIRATISGFDAFVPGLVASAMWAPHRQVDLAGWYRWSDAIRTTTDLYAQADYYADNGQVNTAVINDPANITDAKNAGTFELAIPMEAMVAIRYRHPRRNPRPQGFITQHRGWARDSMSEDLFDIELDLTWANNSAVEAVVIRFDEAVQINGTPGFVPENADVPHHWRDVLGVRLGGDYVPIPDLLALRVGGFFESQGVDDEYLNLDFHAGGKVGVAGGATVRLGPVDISAAYQHTFFLTLDNGGAGLVKTISG